MEGLKDLKRQLHTHKQQIVQLIKECHGELKRNEFSFPARRFISLLAIVCFAIVPEMAVKSWHDWHNSVADRWDYSDLLSYDCLTLRAHHFRSAARVLFSSTGALNRSVSSVLAQR